MLNDQMLSHWNVPTFYRESRHHQVWGRRCSVGVPSLLHYDWRCRFLKFKSPNPRIFALCWVLYRIQEYTSLSNWSVSRCSFRFVKSWYELMWWLIRISNRSDPTWLDHDRDACNCYPEWSSNPWRAGKSPICTQTYRSRFNKSFSYGMNIHRSRFRRLRGLY